MSKKPFVYVVDKDEESLTHIETMFKNQNYTVRTFSEAQRFVNFMSSNNSPLRPALIIIDTLCEGVSGFEIVRRMHERYTGNFVPIIMVTKFESAIDALEAQNAGAIRCLSKPFKFEEVVAAIETERVRRERHAQLRVHVK